MSSDIGVRSACESPLRSTKIAILAMGGEGGAVLADWIVSTAEHAGHYAQSTSVPGVAQRTGATIYYIEALAVPRGSLPEEPVLGLMPTPGDVDVVVASELMESARAVQRGLVTHDKTLLITSSSRTYSMIEKMGLGDGRVDVARLEEAGRGAAMKYVSRDFASLARRHDSVISATLLGAVAASGALPWPRHMFEESIRREGVGVDSSLAAFDAGFDAWSREEVAQVEATSLPPDARLEDISKRIDGQFPAVVRETVFLGAARCADYQGLAYAGEYLTRLLPVAAVQPVADPQAKLLRETARYLALWMTYEDAARVAELKLRRLRFERVQEEFKTSREEILRINEFLHPRLEEIADSLPARLGSRILSGRILRWLVERLTRRGRVIRTSSLSGFLLLYAVAGLRTIRPWSLRYLREERYMQAWMDAIITAARTDASLATEIAECQRLIKGYGETHARGMRSYLRIMGLLPSLAPSGAATLVRDLREAALADESGEKLEGIVRGIDRRETPHDWTGVGTEAVPS